jgi:hypothetical protein
MDEPYERKYSTGLIKTAQAVGGGLTDVGQAVSSPVSNGFRSLGNGILDFNNTVVGNSNNTKNIASLIGGAPQEQMQPTAPRAPIVGDLPAAITDDQWNGGANFQNDIVTGIKARDAGKAMLDEAGAMGKASQAGQWQAPQYTDARNPETAPPLNTAATRAQSLYDRNPAGMHAQMFPTQAPILSHAGSPTTTHFGEGAHGMGVSQGPQAPTVVGHAPVTQQTPMGRVGQHFMGQAPSPIRPGMSRMIADHSRMGMGAKTTRKFV